MPKYSRERRKRIKNLIIISTLSAILLSISTFAWFIGMRTVHVEAFEVEIAGVDGLTLSLDGETFSETVSINEENHSTQFSENTNSWKALIPMSSVGEIDDDVSRLKLYEKASMTATAGGYRLLASRVNNYRIIGEDDEAALETETDGYVVFDLFIRNKSGEEYFETSDPANEEAIYLTVDSEATVKDGGVKETGIENSVRVAFAQIGRVSDKIVDEENGATTIQGIDCNGSGEGVSKVTGICRTAQIWEPNDTAHVDGAISWYNKSCREREGDNVWTSGAYDDEVHCKPIINGIAYPTFAVNQPILPSENTSAVDVDIYDGYFNQYFITTGDYDYNPYDPDGPTFALPKGENPSSPDIPKVLSAFPYFTDTYKYKAGTSRPPFMFLAPASITKVRVYIWIEGQDIDNYDFAQIGKQITINFGFTKSRFEEGDIDYNGPITHQQVENAGGIEYTPPRIILNDYTEIENESSGTGDVIKIVKDKEYQEEGFKAYKRKYPLEDGDSAEFPFGGTEIDPETTGHGLETVGYVDTSVLGTYYVTYKAWYVNDAEEKIMGTAVRTIEVVESLTPQGD